MNLFVFYRQIDALQQLLKAKYLSFFIIISLMVSFNALAETPQQTASKATKILVFGDSISAGFGMQKEQAWPNLLHKNLLKQYPKIELLNASISGETTQGGLNRLPQLLAQYKPTIVFIELGANDGLRGWPIVVMQNNLIAMITHAKEHQAEIILGGMRIPPNYGKRYTELFAKSFKHIAKQENISLMPFILDNIATKPALMQQDGIHPNQQAQAIIATQLQPYFEKLLSKR